MESKESLEPNAGTSSLAKNLSLKQKLSSTLRGHLQVCEEADIGHVDKILTRISLYADICVAL